MSVNYRVVRRTLNFDKANPKEVVVAQTEPRATTGLEDLISLIGQISSISRGDVLSVISTLTRLIADELAKGNIVEIGELRWSSWSAITKPEGCALPVIISTFRGMVLSFPSAPSM